MIAQLLAGTIIRYIRYVLGLIAAFLATLLPTGTVDLPFASTTPMPAPVTTPVSTPAPVLTPISMAVPSPVSTNHPTIAPIPFPTQAPVQGPMGPTFELPPSLLAPALVPTASLPSNPVEIPPFEGEPILPSSNGETSDHSKPVKVFVLSGQSNMVGYGMIRGDKPGTLQYITQRERKYQHLIENGKYAVRDDVRYVYRSSVSSGVAMNMTVGGGADDGGWFFGPELQIGNILGHVFEEPVLILKVGAGNRALGWDFLAPNSPAREFQGSLMAGHGNCPPQFDVTATAGRDNQCGCTVNQECKVFWNKNQCIEQNCWCRPGGDCPKWYAGYQYDRDLKNIHEVLGDLGTFYPGYKNQGFELAGFFFWQGFRDTLNGGYANFYEDNLKTYIESIRRDLASYTKSENVPFVMASVGHYGCDDSKWTQRARTVWQAQMDVGLSQPNTKTVDARPMWRIGADSPAKDPFHYHKNANTFLEAGTKMGWAMADMIQGRFRLDEPRCS